MSAQSLPICPQILPNVVRGQISDFFLATCIFLNFD